MKSYYVYMVTNKMQSVLYTGITNNLKHRVYQHKEGLIEGFTKRYKVCKLVYYEVFRSANGAINREKQIKKWNRQWKVNLIEEHNPNWEDLWDRLN